MKTNLLKKSILAAVVASALASCGDIEGYSNEGFNSNSPITFVEDAGEPLTGETLETPEAILALYEEQEDKKDAFAQAGISIEEKRVLAERIDEIEAELKKYEVRFNLLKNALSGDTNLGDVEDATVYLSSISYEGDLRSPTVPSGTFVVDGTELIVRPCRLAESLTAHGPTNSGTYRITYSLDNGYVYDTDLTAYGLEKDTDPELVRNEELATDLWLYPGDDFEIPTHPVTGLPVARVESRTLWDENGEAIPAFPDDPESEQATKKVLVAVTSTMRTFELTINALRDPVLGLFTQHDEADDPENNDGQIPVIVNTSNNAIVRGLPLNKYDAGFRGWTWESADPSIASVDEQGNITGHKVGQQTIVTASIPDDWYDIDQTLPEGFSPVEPSPEELEGKTEIRLEVNVVEAPTGSESITISNMTNEALADTIEIPSCSTVPFKALPVAKAGETLNGDFLYQWDSEGQITSFAGTQTNNSSEKSGRAVFQANDIYHWNTGTPEENMASISVSLTGVEPIQQDELDITIVENIACKKKRDDAGSQWTYNGKFKGDFEYDSIPSGTGSFWTRGGNGSDAAPAAVALSLENGVSGKGLGITFQTDLNDSKAGNGWYYFIKDGDTYQGRSRSGIEYNDWGGASASLFKGEFGMMSGSAASYGKKVSTSVWVKITNKAQLDQDMTIDFYLSPGGPTNTNQANNRYDPAMLMTAQVEPILNVWQLVTFKDPETGLDYIQLPEEGDDTVTWFGHNFGNGGNNVYPILFFNNVSKDDTIVLDNWAFTSPE